MRARLTWVRLLLDVWYMRRSLLEPLLASRVQGIGQMRRDTALFLPPEPLAQPRRGRPPRYGKRLGAWMRIKFAGLRACDAYQQKSRKKVWLGDYFPEDVDGGELSPNGRVMEMLSEHALEGWLKGYILSGRHGLLNSYEPFIHVATRCAISMPSGWRSVASCPGAPR